MQPGSEVRVVELYVTFTDLIDDEKAVEECSPTSRHETSKNR